MQNRAMDGQGYFVVRIMGGWTVRDSCGTNSHYFEGMADAIDAAREAAIRRFQVRGTPTRVCVERGDGAWIEDVCFGKWSEPP